METKNIKPALPLISVLLLTYAYFYLRNYYIAFGIEVHNFFSVEDYLRASIEYIFKLFFPLVISLYLGMTLAIAEPDSTAPSKKKGKMDTITPYFIMIAFTSLGLLLTFLKENPMKVQRFQLFNFAAMAFWFEFHDKILPKRFTDFLIKKTNLWVFGTIVFIFPLSFNYLYWNAKFNSAKIIESEAPSKIQIAFKENSIKILDEKGVDPKQLLLIGSNSAYFFFYDKCKKSTYILPVGTVENFTIRNP
jgi:hypothetical protein